MMTQPLKVGRGVNSKSELDERLRNAFEEYFQPFAGCHYAYLVIPKARKVKPRIISSYPERWLKVYKAENYYLIDPVIEHGMKCIAPFFWHEALGCWSHEQDPQVFACSRQYRISDGITFILHDANGLFAALSISNTECRDDFEQLMMSRAADIQMILVRFQDDLIHRCSFAELFPERDQTGLSDRELSVLKWVVLGKAYQEIAAICAISVRTVKFHMANVVNKLRVCNAKQAVYKAVSLGLV